MLISRFMGLLLNDNDYIVIVGSVFSIIAYFLIGSVFYIIACVSRFVFVVVLFQLELISLIL